MKTMQPGLFETIVQAISDAVIVFDDDGAIQYKNTAAESLFRRLDTGADHVAKLFPTLPLSIVMLNCQRNETSEMEVMTPQGALMPLVVSWTAWGTGLDTVYAGILRNNLNPKETDLLLDHQHYHLILENVQDVITLHTPGGVCEYVSPAVQAILGYTPHEFVGFRPRDLFHPADAEALDAVGHQLLNGEQAGRLCGRIRHKAGHYVWMETSFQAIEDDGHQRVRLLGVGRDVTEQMRLRQQLEDAIRISGLGHWEWDVTNDRVVWSEQMYRIFGVCPGEIELTFDTVTDFVHPDDRDRLRLEIGRRLQLGQTFDTEWRVIRRDGVPCYVRAQGQVYYDASNKPKHMIGTLHDVTDIKRTDEILLRSEKLSALGQLAAGIAHEIRNPLTALKGFTQLLRGAVSQGHQPYLDIMVSELNRIERILSELLVLAKPQAVFFHPNDVGAILQDVLPIINSQALMMNVTIELEFEPNTPLVNCEANQLKQVFVNVMKNAIEAMPTGGQLTVGLKVIDNERVLVQFRDQGPGIPSDLLPKLGEPFFTTKEKGTGLGLMTSNKIITAHHGHLHIDSELGKGTTVNIVLPGLID